MYFISGLSFLKVIKSWLSLQFFIISVVFHAKLRHYSDTVGQWYRTVLGWCLSVAGTPGSKDYFQAGGCWGYVFKLMKYTEVDVYIYLEPK